jgi:hypothetical protein
VATPILNPAGGMHEALSAYLAEQVTLATSIDTDSIVEQRWPEPTEDLQIGHGPPAKIRVGITRIGAARGGNRIGGPVLSRLDVAASPAAVARFDFDEVSQDFAIGVWSPSQRIRDEMDEIVSGWLSQPFWTTVSPLVATTLTSNVTKAGKQKVSVATMKDVWYRTKLQIGTGGGAEVVEVLDLAIERGQLTFVAAFRKTHSSGAAVVEVPARRDYAGSAANAISLRVPLHFNAIALFDFEEPSSLDEERGQRQEWTSIRQGVGTMRHIANFPAVVQATIDANIAIGLGPNGVPGTTRTISFL